MTTAQITADVDRGLKLVEIIDRAKTELKQIEKRLEQAGLAGEQIPLVDADREGRQYLAKGTASIVPVVFESDQIVASFSIGSAALSQAEVIAGSAFRNFYVRPAKVERVPKDGKQFRSLARDLLGLQAPAFIDACVSRDKDGIKRSRTVIAWDRPQTI